MDDLATSVAALLREAASTFVLPRFGRLADSDIESKSSPTDLVTVADREAEIWLTPRLTAIVDAVVVGEEACSATPSLRDRAGEARAWTVDPVDGTSNFVKGNERFCSMVSLLEGGVPVRSWIWLPLAQELYYAEAGQGRLLVFAEWRDQALALDDRPLTLDEMTGGASIRDVAEPVKNANARQATGAAGPLVSGKRRCSGNRHRQRHTEFSVPCHLQSVGPRPVDLRREAGGHAGMIKDGGRYNASLSGGLL